MNDPLRNSASELDESHWKILDQAVNAFEEAWHKTPGPHLSDFLPQTYDLLQKRVLIELIKVDQEFRLERGNLHPLEGYLQEWPELTKEPFVLKELLESECFLRGLFGDLPVQKDLIDRFPEISKIVNLSGIQVRVRKESQKQNSKSKNAIVDSAQLESFHGDHRPEESFLPGTKLKRYEIRELIDRGGMGAVYRAQDLELGREVALKIPYLQAENESELAERFLKEARTAAQLKHPNVCQILDVGQANGCLFLTMSLADGQSLAKLLESEVEQRLDVLRAVRIVRKLALALQAVHEAGIVHRDIKPGNIMIDQAGEPLLVDFGLAWLIEEDRGKRDQQSFSGTPAYMAPEQIPREKDQVDWRVDVYSLGVILFQILTGRVPFNGSTREVLSSISTVNPQSPKSFQPNIPRRLEQICLKAMAKRPEDRYQSAAEMADALEHYLRWARMKKVVLAACLLLLPIVGIAGYYSQELRTLVFASEKDESGSQYLTKGHERSFANKDSDIPGIIGRARSKLRGKSPKTLTPENTSGLRSELLKFLEDQPAEKYLLEAARLMVQFPWHKGVDPLKGNIWCDVSNSLNQPDKVVDLPELAPYRAVAIHGKIDEKHPKNEFFVRFEQQGPIVIQIISLTAGFALF